MEEEKLFVENVEVCPTVAIYKEMIQQNFNFSQIDCHGCGGCISVCQVVLLIMHQQIESLFEMSKFYKK